eukprot:scaffold274381_cov52-Attheya_sp.AAC.1
MGNSTSQSCSSPSSKSTRSTSSGSTLTPSYPKTKLPKTEEEYAKNLHKAYRLGLEASTDESLPKCNNPNVKYEWLKVDDFPVDKWKSNAGKDDVCVWGPCPGCDAIISTLAIRTKLYPEITSVCVTCNCNHDHGAGIGGGCGRHVRLGKEGGF